MQDLRVGSLCLPYIIGQILRAYNPTVKCMGTTVTAMANDAIFNEQSMGIHFICRIINLLCRQRMRCTA